MIFTHFFLHFHITPICSISVKFVVQMKSSGRTPRGGMQPQSVIPHGLPHGNVISPSEGHNKSNHGKVQPARSIVSMKNAQPNNQQTSQPNPADESLGVTVMLSSTLQDVESSSEMSVEVPNKICLESSSGNVIDITEGQHIDLTQNIGTADEKSNISDPSSTVDVEKSSRETVAEGLICGEVNLSNVEGPVLHEAMDISLDKLSLEGTDNVPSLNSLDNMLMVGEHNPCISSATEIDSLCGQLGVMDINSQTEKSSDSHSLSCTQSDVNSQDNRDVVELCSRKEHLDCPQVEESFNGSCSPNSTRRPFAVKDSVCNMDDSCRVSTESSVAELKSNLFLPQSMSKEN